MKYSFLTILFVLNTVIIVHSQNQNIKIDTGFLICDQYPFINFIAIKNLSIGDPYRSLNIDQLKYKNGIQFMAEPWDSLSIESWKKFINLNIKNDEDSIVLIKPLVLKYELIGYRRENKKIRICVLDTSNNKLNNICFKIDLHVVPRIYLIKFFTKD